MDRFGVDKPDLRFGMELVELTDVFAAHRVQGLRRRRRRSRASASPGVADEYGRNKLDELTDRAKQLGAKGLVWMKVADGRRARVAGRQVPVATPSRPALRRARSAREPGDLLLIVADEWATTCEVLGQLRNDLGRPPVHEGPYRYLWVVDFPLFVGVDATTGRPKPGHHPFTLPHPDDLAPARDRPADGPQPQAYDLVLNGWELGSGSIRIHQPELQRRIFDAARHQRRGGRADASGSSSTRSGTARRRTAGSPSASTAWSRSSPARRTSARSSPSRRPSRASTR